MSERMTGHQRDEQSAGTVESLEATGANDAGKQTADANGDDLAHVHSDEELNQFIEQLCLSKAEEFQLLGYENVTGKDIWECVSEAYEKQGVPLLHQIVNDILSLKVTKFMNWITLRAYSQENVDDFYKELKL